MDSARSLLLDGQRRLRAAGIESSRVDAELLLAHVLQVDRSTLWLADRLFDHAADQYNVLIERRSTREPLQHLLGLTAFRKVMLEVGPGVFIPRPETELLIDLVAENLTPSSTVVDLCSGSGAIALAVLAEDLGRFVYAVEKSPEALSWLRRNADEKIVALRGDVTDPDLLFEIHGRVDAVISNPPYVPAGADVAPEVLADPAEAVFAGPDGLDVIPHVIARAVDLLKPGGIVAIEHDESHQAAVKQMLGDDTANWRDVTTHKDLAGRARFVTAIRASGRHEA